MRILVFGDSITQGFWDTEGGWVERLRREYDKKAINKPDSQNYATVFNLGISGDKSDSVLKRMRPEIEARQGHDEEIILVFAVGANNTYIKHGKPYGTVEAYQADIVEIIGVAKEYANKIMFIGLTSCDESRTTPVFWDDVVWKNERIKEFNQALEQVCQSEKVAFIPLFELFQAEQSKRNLLEDGIHPNNEGHIFIADALRPVLEKLISP